MKHYIAFLSCALLAAVACNKTPEQTVEPTPLSVRISPTITKVTENYFENGDAIGLTIERTSGTYAENQKLTYNGNVFDGSLTWYTPATESSTLKAYYPYSAIASPKFTVATDQSNGLSSSDFVSAVQENVLPSENAVSMTFQHRLTRLNIEVVNNSGNDYSNLTIGNVIPTAIISSDQTATVDESSTKATIVPYKSSETYYAIIPPQKAQLKVSLTLNGKTVEQVLPEVEYLSGREHKVKVTLENDSMNVIVTGTIEGWGSVDDPAVYSKRLIRAIYCDNESFNLSYDTMGRLTDVKIHVGAYEAAVKVSYDTDKTSFYWYKVGDTGELYNFIYENNVLVGMNGDNVDTTEFHYDANGHMDVFTFDGDGPYSLSWLGNDAIILKRESASGYNSRYTFGPSSHLDLDYLSSLILGEEMGDGLFMYIMTLVTDGAFAPASEHLYESAPDLPKIEYTFLPDGHVREMRCYKNGSTTPDISVKLYFIDEPEEDDVPYAN